MSKRQGVQARARRPPPPPPCTPSSRPPFPPHTPPSLSQTFRREHDRFGSAAHPDSNLLAAGHDGGMLVFKLERSAPRTSPSTTASSSSRTGARPPAPSSPVAPPTSPAALSLRAHPPPSPLRSYVRLYEYSSAKDTPLMTIRRSGGLNTVARSVHYNEQESVLLVNLDSEGGSYELYQVPKDGRGAEAGSAECKRGLGTSAVFVARQRFAVLDKNKQILIKNFQNEVTKKVQPPHASTDSIYPAGTGCLLLRSEERVTLFDVQQRKAMAELNVPGTLKYIIWSHDQSRVALLSKHGIVIATRKLEQLCMTHETIRIKSGGHCFR